MRKHDLRVCINCPHDDRKKDKTGPIFHERVKSAVESDSLLSNSMSVKTVKCMGGCEKPHVISLTSPNKDILLFNDISLSDEGIGDLLVCLRTYVRSSNGRVAMRNRPESMKRNLLVRIPPFSEEY